MNSLLIDLENKIQLIGEKICIMQESLDRINCKITELEEFINDHSCMINELERSVALFTNTVKTNLITNHEPASNGVRVCTNNAHESSAPLYSDVVKSVHESVSLHLGPLLAVGSDQSRTHTVRPVLLLPITCINLTPFSLWVTVTPDMFIWRGLASCKLGFLLTWWTILTLKSVLDMKLCGCTWGSIV